MDDTSTQETAPVNRTRRAIYVFGVSLWCLAVPTAVVFLKIDSPLAELVVKSMLGIVTAVAVTYLGTSTIDRSNILGKLGDAATGNRKVASAQPNRKLIVGDTETIGTTFRRTYG